MQSNYNYTELRGGTGPLVYPAGFVYMFSGLYWATDLGANVWRAQLIFTFFYIATFATVAAIYAKAAPTAAADGRGFHPLLLGTLCISKRVHSIFVLRLFNDGPTMLLLYIAVLCFVHRRWTIGCVIFSVPSHSSSSMIDDEDQTSQARMPPSDKRGISYHSHRLLLTFTFSFNSMIAGIQG